MRKTLTNSWQQRLVDPKLKYMYQPTAVEFTVPKYV